MNNELYPFRIATVSGKIHVSQYIELIKNLYIPLASDEHFNWHDRTHHIEPALHFIKHHSPTFMHEIKNIIQQYGTHQEKQVDYIMFEIVSFMISQELIAGYCEGLTRDRIPGLIHGKAVLDTDEFDKTPEITMNRFLDNYLKLNIDKFLNRTTDSLFPRRLRDRLEKGRHNE